MRREGMWSLRGRASWFWFHDFGKRPPERGFASAYAIFHRDVCWPRAIDHVTHRRFRFRISLPPEAYAAVVVLFRAPLSFRIWPWPALSHVTHLWRLTARRWRCSACWLGSSTSMPSTWIPRRRPDRRLPPSPAHSSSRRSQVARLQPWGGFGAAAWRWARQRSETSPRRRKSRTSPPGPALWTSSMRSSAHGVDVGPCHAPPAAADHPRAQSRETLRFWGS